MTKDELKAEIESYCSRLTYINSSFELYKHMINSQKDHLSEINEFPAFYQMSKKANLHFFIIELAKMYEYSGKSDTGIEKLIKICEANQNLFLKKYTSGYLDEDSGKEEVFTYKVDIKKDIEEAKTMLSDLNEIVGNLKGQRDSFYAHLDKQYKNDSKDLISDYPLKYDEIKQLIDTASNICNKFLVDLCRTSYVTQMSNWDDINNIFSIVKDWKEKRHNEIEMEINKLKGKE